MNELVSKLVLGTVQFGCSYGINSAGRPSNSMVREILSLALSAGIRTLDTSSAYGNAEEVLHDAMPQEAGFRIVSKYPKGSPAVRDCFTASLRRLGVPCLYGYMLHHFELYRSDPSVWDGFRALREDGLVRKIGFSLYGPEELELLLKREVDFNLLQIPRNLFDRRFDDYLPELQARGVEVHVRSTFLQGLFFKDRESLSDKLLPLKKYLLELDEYAAARNMSVAEAALNYNLQNPHIGGVLIGVDNVSQLKSNLACVSGVPVEPDIRVAGQELLNPANWN